MDIVPTLIDGAVVVTLQQACKVKSHSCEACYQGVALLHNWLKVTRLNYLIFDFQDEREVCPAFLEEMILARKRLRFPFLFSGVMEQARTFLENYNYGVSYPIFVVPEDAIRALRMQHPGMTEVMPVIPIVFDCPLSQVFNMAIEDTFERRDIRPEVMPSW